MGAGDEQLHYRVFILGRHAAAALAAARLRPESVERGAFDIAIMRDGDDHLLTLDQVFIFQTIPSGGDFRQPRGGVGGADFRQFFAHHGVKFYPVAKDRKISLDRQRQALQFITDFVAAQRGQAVQAQFEDRLHLPFGQAIGATCLIGVRLNRFDQPDILRNIANRPFLRQQARARCRRIGRAADHRHHFVKVGNGDHQTQQQMRPLTRLGEFILGAPGDHFFAEGDESRDKIAQHQRFGPPSTDGQHVGGER